MLFKMVQSIGSMFGPLGRNITGHKAGSAIVFVHLSEENDLIAFLIESADIGYGRTRQEVCQGCWALNVRSAEAFGLDSSLGTLY